MSPRLLSLVYTAASSPSSSATRPCLLPVHFQFPYLKQAKTTDLWLCTRIMQCLREFKWRVKDIVFPNSIVHCALKCKHNDRYCKVSKRHVNTKCKFQHLCKHRSATKRNKTRFIRLMFLSHFGKFARLILRRYSMEFYAVWTAAWAIFRLQNGVSAFENSNYFLRY